MNVTYGIFEIFLCDRNRRKSIIFTKNIKIFFTKSLWQYRLQ